MKIQQLTFTRFIAAILIVIFHLGKDIAFFTKGSLSFIFTQANVGVSYFFVLSGFVMIIAYKDKAKIDFIEFIKNRLARIYPVYFLAIFITIGMKMFIKINWYDFVLNVFMIQAWIPYKALTINFPGWSISVEMFFYLIFPLLVNKFYRKYSVKSTLSLIIVFWILNQIFFQLLYSKYIDVYIFHNENMYYHPFLHLNEFLIGNLTAICFLSNYKKESNENYMFPILGLLIVVVLLLKYHFGINYHNGFLSLLFVPLIYLISSSNDCITNFFKKDIFVFLGEISFSVYILQRPVSKMFTPFLIEKYTGLKMEINDPKLFLIRLMSLLIISSISYFMVEKPLRNKIKKINTTNFSFFKKKTKLLI
jgi:peptidoglycan/LPS O-acetylase OafA/YrhL